MLLPPSRVALRAFKFVRALINRDWRRAVLSQGVLAASEHTRILTRLDVSTVVDVGANRGQYALACRAAFPHALIISFEPLPEAADAFERVFHDHTRVILIRAAVDSAAGSQTMHVSAREDSSSLLPIGQGQARHFHGTAEARRLTVTTGSLETFVSAQDLVPPALLKLDVQGNELSTLRACKTLAERFDYAQVEVSFEELYEGQALASEIVSELLQWGLSLRSIDHIYRPAWGFPVQADFLFVRTKRT